MNYKEEISIINKAYCDTNFLLDKPTYTTGLKKCIKGWVLSLSLCNLILFFYSMVLQRLSLIDIDIFYQIHNILFVVLNIIPLFLYLYFLLQRNVTLREKHFLRIFLIIPILIFLSKILFPLAFYFNFEYLLALYDSVSLELIATLIATLMLYSFFKENHFLYLTFFTFLYILISSFIKIVCLNTETINYLVIIFFNIVDFIHTYSIFSMLIFLFVILFISKDSNESRFVKYI